MGSQRDRLVQRDVSDDPAIVLGHQNVRRMRPFVEER